MVDFDRVGRELILLAIQAADIVGSTTLLIASVGNGRGDVLQMLANADMVVADISVHNVTVFYELGARDALRDMHTFMIREAGVDVPSELKTDHYLGYPRDNPAAAPPQLVVGLKQSLIDQRRADSPIFNLLPALKPPEIRLLVPLPEAFQEEVAQVAEGRRIGHLVQACEDYAEAFDSDIGHFHRGAYALGMARRRVDLAKAYPDDWADGYDSDDAAEKARDELNADMRDLCNAVQLSVERGSKRLADDRKEQRWTDITVADVQLLRGERVRRVVAAYRKALEGSTHDYFVSVERQWSLYTRLGLFKDTLAELAPLRVILLSGHRIDAANPTVFCRQGGGWRARQSSIASSSTAPALRPTHAGSAWPVEPRAATSSSTRSAPNWASPSSCT